jgi:hypothetical protein
MCSTKFDPYGLSVKDFITKAELLRCNSSGTLYPIFPATSPAALAATTSRLTDLWHRRHGHPRDSTTFSQHFPHCNNTDGRLCQIYQLGKHHGLPFSSSTSRSSFLFQLIHCDLWTAPIQSVSGNKYYLITIDDFSNYMWTFPLALKSDVHEKFHHFHAFIHTHFHTTIGTIQCDNGREFDNMANSSFLLPFDTTMRFSCPYTLPQNGKAERAIRTTNDVVRTLLL